ncbi:uncharacterized protein EHS24_008509 [Apiotrichum porosum]|uniref:Ammonia (Ammonium) transport outward n=1 Tax=Apiotrichum porosum TaxID=105984 RepID=A0A427XQI0_9TREE|nr:uncharacterized protein EHS24_008509 [Apiotrichum porosum]RSH81075.1 hypothetical protein EHS24_008509 [Apiotrichum porosum]
MSSHEDLKTNAGPEAGETGAGYQGSGGVISRFVTPGGHPQDNTQPAFPVFHRKFANPAPLGLMSFGGTTILLSLFNLGTRDITHPNVLVGVALFYGGFCQILAGCMEWACGNSFGTCAFTGYGAFWMSFGVIYIPWFGILEAYTDKQELANALGLYLVMWGIVTFLLTLCLLRSSVMLLFVFADITLTFFLLAASEFTGNHTVHMAGGGFGVIGGFAAMYTAVAGLMTADTAFWLLPVGDLSPK